jgi:hypothetical protein
MPYRAKRANSGDYVWFVSSLADDDTRDRPNRGDCERRQRHRRGQDRRLQRSPDCRRAHALRNGGDLVEDDVIALPLAVCVSGDLYRATA